MKKTILRLIVAVTLIVAVIIVIIFATGICLSPLKSKASDKAISVAKRAIEVTDAYLDGKIQYKTAIDNLDSLCDEMDYVDELTKKDDNKKDDLYISVDVLLLSSAVWRNSLNSDDKTYASIVNHRNDLADSIGMEHR